MNPLEEHVVLVDDAGRAIGTELKATVHHAMTPLHLAFSVFLFDDQGRALFQQRALHKPTWPGIWSNACCGHPLPGESFIDAARRRLAYEMGIVTPFDLELALPTFRYRARWGKIWENEICPVFIGRYCGPINPRPAEVAAVRWIDWQDFADACLEPASLQHSAFAEFSPWSRWEAAELLTARNLPFAALAGLPERV